MEHLKRTIAKYCYYNNCFVLCLNCRAFLQDWRSVGTGNAWNEETAHAFMGLSVCALELEEGRGREVESSCHLSAGDMKTNVGTHLGNRKDILGHIRDKGGHSIMLSCQSDHKMFSSFFPQKPNTAPRVSHWRCRGEWGSCVTLTFCRIWTPSCFCPSRASQLHFCCLHVTSSLLLAEYFLSWRDSIHLGGGEERNVKGKPNHQVNAQQTAVVQFQMGTDGQPVQKSPRKYLGGLEWGEWTSSPGFAVPYRARTQHKLQGKTRFMLLPMPLGLCFQRAACSRWLAIPKRDADSLQGALLLRLSHIHVAQCLICPHLSSDRCYGKFF